MKVLYAVIGSLLLWVGAAAYGQNAAILNRLKAQYSQVEYQPECGGWYLLIKQNGANKEYGFASKTGKVIAAGASDYKKHEAFIELYMLDTQLKAEYDQWKVAHDQWEKEYAKYEQAKKVYDNKVEVLEEAIAAKRAQAVKKTGDAYLDYFNNLKARFMSPLPEDENKAKAELLKQGIEEPVAPSEPEGVSSAYQWISYTYIQPQPFEEISFEDLESAESGNACRFVTVKKNGLYGVADKSLRLVVPCKYKEDVLSTANDGFQVLEQNGLYGAINRKGVTILKISYEGIREAANGNIVVEKANKYGLYDTDGKEILPCIFADISFATESGQPFSSFAQKYVENTVNEWQKRGEFEKTDLWRQRVNEDTRKQKILELTKQAQQAYIKIYANNLEDKMTLGKYDPDNETFLVNSEIGGKMLVPVPIDKAPAFKDKFAECTKTPVYFIQNDKIGIARCEFKLSNTEKYTFNNQASLNYSIAQVEYNFDPISISPVPSDTSVGKQTISTVSLSVGKSDVDIHIPQSATVNDKTFAVIISNENYQNEKRVEYANNDGYVFKEYCIKTLGLPAQNVHYRSDATYNNIRFELNWIKQVTEAYHGESSVILYYAGHGVPDEASREAYLLPTDGISSDVTTGFSFQEMYKTLGALPVKNVCLILDACFSGALRGQGMLASARGVAIKAKSDIPQGRMVVFSAATGDQTAYPYKEKGHGLFTYFFLKKLQETKGEATLGEISDYVSEQVARQSIVINSKSQTPTVTPSAIMADTWKGLKLK